MPDKTNTDPIVAYERYLFDGPAAALTATRLPVYSGVADEAAADRVYYQLSSAILSLHNNALRACGVEVGDGESERHSAAVDNALRDRFFRLVETARLAEEAKAAEAAEAARQAEASLIAQGRRPSVQNISKEREAEYQRLLAAPAPVPERDLSGVELRLAALQSAAAALAAEFALLRGERKES